MTFSFNKLKHLLKRTKRKDAGISLARARKNWHTMLIGATCIVLGGAAAASYEFLHIESADSAVITDPVETTRYREGDIKKALDKYDALRVKYEIDKKEAPVVKVVTIEETEEEDVALPVASSTSLRVE